MYWSCSNCRWQLPSRVVDDRVFLVCEAFPEKIPPPILWGEWDHVFAHVDGDHGLLWEPRPGDPMPRAVLAAFRARRGGDGRATPRTAK